MSLLDCLADKEKWQEFLEYKVSKQHMSKSEIEDLTLFIEREEYLPVLKKIYNKEKFPCPSVKKINKKNTSKKRLVFTFEREENYVLKLLAYMLHKYDFLFCDNLYSFRKNTGVKQAVFNIVHSNGIKRMSSYKVDIHDYFNSVDKDKITELITKYITDDTQLREFLISVITNPFAYEDGVLKEFKKGIMAGVPVSGFLANLYLMEMDRYFEENNILYARYSDDIIVFAEKEEKLSEYKDYIYNFLESRGLTINPKKEWFSIPGETWEFLGFSYSEGFVDISKIAFEKLKAKMKRKARALCRWKVRKGASQERAIRAFIAHFNKKLYDNPIHNDITWCRWYFPVITTDATLREIDRYMLSCIRYIATGKHTKKNFNLRYETIKELGFKSLVNMYYKNK